MKFSQPRTFRDVISPAILIRWALGVGTIEYPAGRQRRAISMCWSVTYLIVFLTYANFSIQSRYSADITTASPSDWMFLIGNIICGCGILFFGQFESKKLMDSLSKLDEINHMLSKLGIPNEYGVTFKYQVIHVTGILLFVCTSGGICILNNLNNSSTAVICHIISAIYIVLCGFLDEFVFSTSIRYILTRFQHLNAYLAKSSIKENNAIPFLQNSDLCNPRLVQTILEINVQPRSVSLAYKLRMMHIIQTVRNIHHNLCSTAMNINKSLGVQLLLSGTITFVFITSELFSIYTASLLSTSHTTQRALKILSKILFIGYLVVKVIYIVDSCSTAATEAQKTGDRIYELVDPTSSYEVREEIQAFSIQLILNPLQFSACGYFTLDYSTLRAMTGTVVTYLVIMIQMHVSDDDITDNSQNATD